MLIERAYCLHCLIAEGQHARDVGAALASSENDIARARRPARHQRDELPGAAQPESSSRHVARRETECLEWLRPVGDLEIGLDVVIVGAEQHGEPRGVARAPEVL